MTISGPRINEGTPAVGMLGYCFTYLFLTVLFNDSSFKKINSTEISCNLLHLTSDNPHQVISPVK